MSAEILRRAAALMRERADWATPGPWHAKITDDRQWCLVTNGDPEVGVAAQCADDDDADHLASWHPDVALAVADWLDDEGIHFDADDTTHARAIAVARTYLGESA